MCIPLVTFRFTHNLGTYCLQHSSLFFSVFWLRSTRRAQPHGCDRSRCCAIHNESNVRMSPMSNVQSPKSASKTVAEIGEGQLADGEKVRVGKADLGLGTWDLGLLRVTDLRKSFTSPAGENIDVLRGVSFSADLGQALAITGASGAGKSTLLHLLG